MDRYVGNNGARGVGQCAAHDAGVTTLGGGGKRCKRQEKNGGNARNRAALKRHMKPPNLGWMMRGSRPRHEQLRHPLGIRGIFPVWSQSAGDATKSLPSIDATGRGIRLKMKIGKMR